VRGSSTVSLTRLAAKNQSWPVISGSLSGSSGRSPLSVFWWYGSNQRSLTIPSVSISRQRSGIGIWSVGNASGGGARTAPGLSCVTSSGSGPV
jgi:hypothetical protein